jgi:Ca2+-binding EF-hand superfamily protein
MARLQGKEQAEGTNVAMVLTQETNRLEAAYKQRDLELKTRTKITTPTAGSSTALSSSAEQKQEQEQEQNEVDLPPVACQVRHVQAGLRRYDPKIPQAEINRVIAAGLKVPMSGLLVDGRNINSADLFSAETGVPDLHQFMTNVQRSMVINRYSPMPAEELEIQQDQFVRSLPAEELDAIAEMFALIDVDCSGSITTAELRMLLKETYGLHPTQAEISKLTAQLDADGDGSITLEEFTRALGTVPELQNAADMFKWKSMFLEADSDKSGYLNFDEVSILLVRSGILSPRRVVQIAKRHLPCAYRTECGQEVVSS